jgi:hypothetical protein
MKGQSNSPPKVRPAGLPWIIAALSAIATFIGLFFVFIPQESGFLLYDTEKNEDIKYVLTLFLDYYTNITQLIISAFGAVAFLVTYQQSNKMVVSLGQWSLLSAGLIFMTGALIISFLSREVLLLMVNRNAMDFDLQALRYGRWIMYISIILAAVFIGYYAKEVAVRQRDISKPEAEPKHVS